MKKIVALIGLIALPLALQGCAESAIADISQDKVVIQQNASNMDQVNAQAAKACAMYGRKPTYLSVRCAGSYCSERLHLFACRPEA